MNKWSKNQFRIFSIVINILLNIIFVINIWYSFFYIENFIILLINIVYYSTFLIYLLLERLFKYITILRFLEKNNKFLLICKSLWIDLYNSNLESQNFDLELNIKLAFFKRNIVSINAKANNSQSYSFNEKIIINGDQLHLKYSYKNNPTKKIPEKLHKHRGNAVLVFSAKSNLIKFEYFNASDKRVSLLKNWEERK